MRRVRPVRWLRAGLKFAGVQRIANAVAIPQSCRYDSRLHTFQPRPFGNAFNLALVRQQFRVVVRFSVLAWSGIWSKSQCVFWRPAKFQPFYYSRVGNTKDFGPLTCAEGYAPKRYWAIVPLVAILLSISSPFYVPWNVPNGIVDALHGETLWPIPQFCIKPFERAQFWGNPERRVEVVGSGFRVFAAGNHGAPTRIGAPLGHPVRYGPLREKFTRQASTGLSSSGCQSVPAHDRGLTAYAQAIPSDVAFAASGFFNVAPGDAEPIKRLSGQVYQS